MCKYLKSANVDNYVIWPFNPKPNLSCSDHRKRIRDSLAIIGTYPVWE
jgi:hypothetical protein